MRFQRYTNNTILLTRIGNNSTLSNGKLSAERFWFAYIADRVKLQWGILLYMALVNDVFNGNNANYLSYTIYLFQYTRHAFEIIISVKLFVVAEQTDYCY